MDTLAKQFSVLVDDYRTAQKEALAITVKQGRIIQKMAVLVDPKVAVKEKTRKAGKPCPQCHVMVGAATQKCKSCGYRFPPREQAIRDAVVKRLKKKRATLGELVTAAMDFHVVKRLEIKKLVVSLVSEGLITQRGTAFFWKRRKK